MQFLLAPRRFGAASGANRVNASSLANQVVVITGAAGGIGKACASRLSTLGARIVALHRSASAHSGPIVQHLVGDGHLLIEADVCDSAELSRAAIDVRARFGRVDALINCAGFTQLVPHSDLDGLSDGIIDQTFNVNWRGAFAAIRAFAHDLGERDGGVIVNISSIAATTGVGSSVAYCASKAALDSLTVTLARALAPRIRVISISPGLVDTDFVPGRDHASRLKASQTTPLQRLVTADDVARAVEAAITHLAFTTGSIIQVDAGRHL